MAGARPIIVIKKKGAHGGHMAARWKVAYAVWYRQMESSFYG